MHIIIHLVHYLLYSHHSKHEFRYRLSHPRHYRTRCNYLSTYQDADTIHVGPGAARDEFRKCLGDAAAFVVFARDPTNKLVENCYDL